MSYYMFFHFKSDIVPHPAHPHPTPGPILHLVFVSFTILNLLLSTHIVLLSLPCLFPVLYSTVFCLFPFPPSPPSLPPPIISVMYLVLAMPCFHFLSLPLFLLLLLSVPTHHLCASLCVSGDTAAGAGGQFSAGGGASGRGVV